MAETEVETILREIRERVLAQQHAGQNAAGTTARALTSGGNGAGDVQAGGASTAESLALISSHLTATGRAWDRLPPVVSQRSGLLARVELWLKRKIRAGTRWFTWEQVNFNAAVHHALQDLLPVLTAHEQEIRKIDAARRTDHEELRAELRERDGHLRDEQRVCFKQITLESSEASVLEDRARRKTEALLAELEHRIEALEKK